MTITFSSKPKSLTKEAKYINDVEEVTYKDFISNSIYLRNRYQESLEDHFENLKSIWLDEIKLSSNIFITLQHPAHIKIVELGYDVLPLMLKDLKENKNHWFYTLSLISEDNPVKSENLGNMDNMIDDWMEWGASKNLVN